MWRRICKKYFQSGGQDGSVGITEIGLQIFDYRWLLGSWSHHCWGIDSRSGSLSWWHEKCGGLCTCQGLGEFWRKVWRISFWFFGVFHLWCFCCIYFGWQRDGKEKMEIKAQGEFFSLRRNSYGHWTFEFFAKHCKVTTDNQIMNVWDGCYYFIMCWPFFRRSVFVFSPLGLLVVVFSSDQRFASRK